MTITYPPTKKKKGTKILFIKYGGKRRKKLKVRVSSLKDINAESKELYAEYLAVASNFVF